MTEVRLSRNTISDPCEYIVSFLKGWKVEDYEDCAQLLMESLAFLGFELRQRHYSPMDTDEPLTTHCNICGASAGKECQPISSKSPALNRRFHMERVTAGMHKERTR